MSAWLIIEEETVTADGPASHRQVKARTANGKTREEALVELYRAARNYNSDSLKRGTTVVGRDSDGSFWVLPKNGKSHASCNLRLIEQIRT
ncbi:hypothetical protein AB0N17_38810 [Streptomyces sp. NPDC051133]|uniref:hypothetical protein n=1 Tax=Streptomyces sp. NPDC051133 TaxID=3155521 RepID=UPI003434C73A